MRRALRALVICASLTCPLPTDAQPREQTDARQLFLEGIGHARASQWPLAMAAFEAAFALAPKPSVLFNLAGAQLRCGKMLASSANYRRFVASADPSITAVHRRAAQQQVERIEQRVPRLRVLIEGLKDGDRILLDQARLYPDELGHDMWIDPGVHTVRVDRPRGDQEARTIAVSEGQVRVLSFRLP
jgi:hypothetical protein